MKISYYAVFQYEADSKQQNVYGINIYFPDVSGCFSCADSDEEGKIMAQKALELMLHNSVKKELPRFSKKSEIQRSKFQKLIKITVNMKQRKGRLYADDVDSANIK